MRVKSLVKLVLVAVALAPVVLVTAACVTLGPRPVLTALVTATWPRHFSQEQWRQHPKQRGYMTLDLAAHGGLRGMTARQVLAMLGEPDYIEGGVPAWESVERDSDEYYAQVGRMVWFADVPYAGEQDLEVVLESGKVRAWYVGKWKQEATAAGVKAYK